MNSTITAVLSYYKFYDNKRGPVRIVRWVKNWLVLGIHMGTNICANET